MVRAQLDESRHVGDLAAIIGEVVGAPFSIEHLELGAPVADLGIDSIGAVEIIVAIETANRATAGVLDRFYRAHPGMPGFGTVADLLAFWDALERFAATEE